VRYEGLVRNHIDARLGHMAIRRFQKPSIIQGWIKELQEIPLQSSTIGGIGDVLSSIFDAAVDDGLIYRNPCKAGAVRWPQPVKKAVVPWSRERVLAVVAGLPERFRVGGLVGVGCGLRQGEIFALSEGDIDFEGGWLNVNQQIRFVGKTMVFALPKGDKVRSVPLSLRTAVALRTHLKSFPSTEVTLPWAVEGGKPRTLRLLFVDANGKAYNRSVFNAGDWKRALVHAGVLPPRVSGAQYFAAAPDDGMHALRHTYASAQLEGGTNIKALSVFLGHSDAGFTLRTYTHLMPGSEGRSRSATDDFLAGGGHQEQGTERVPSAPVCPESALAA